MPSKSSAQRIKTAKNLAKKLPKKPAKAEDDVIPQDINVDEVLAAIEREEASATPVEAKTNNKKKKQVLKEEESVQETSEEVVGEPELNSEDEKELELYMTMMKKATEGKDEQETPPVGVATGVTDGEYEERVYPNRIALIQERINDIQVLPNFPWIETQTITSSTITADSISDVHNDLERELAFYKQALDAAVQGKEKVLAAGVPFDRPDDYYAEMVKSDEHMERIRQRLLDEAVGLKAAEEARKQRELKKFGKKLQQEKLLERQKKKKDELEKIRLARKRGQSRANMEGADADEGATGLSAGTFDDEAFDVSLDDDSTPQKSRNGGNNDGPKKGKKRQYKDEKFGFGGKKKFRKSNTAESTDDLSAFNPKKMKYGKKKQGGRPGKKAGKVGGR